MEQDVFCCKCGAHIPEGRLQCIVCDTRKVRPGFWQRLCSFFNVRTSSDGNKKSFSFSVHLGDDAAKHSAPASLHQVQEILAAAEKSPNDLAQVTHIKTKIPFGKLSISTNVKRSYTIQDASGQKVTYDSLEEMPPEVRERLQKFLPPQ